MELFRRLRLPIQSDHPLWSRPRPIVATRWADVLGFDASTRRTGMGTRVMARDGGADNVGDSSDDIAYDCLDNVLFGQ
jgi:hypothetical protein